MANVDQEKLEQEKVWIRKRQKELTARMRKINNTQKDLSRKDETTIGMTFWRFVSTRMADQYEKIIKCNAFDEYVDMDYTRKLFGLEPRNTEEMTILQVQSLNIIPEDAAKEREDRLYLDTTYDEKKAVREAGATWDGTVIKKWYVLEGTDLAPYTQWNPHKLPYVELLAMFASAFAVPNTTGAE